MRQLIPRDVMRTRIPLLAASLALMFLAMALFASGHDFGAVTALIAAFLFVGGAKRAG